MNDETRAQITLRYSFREDVLTVHGVRYAGELFRLVHGASPGTRFELVLRDDGVITLNALTPVDATGDAVPLQIVVDNDAQ